MNVRKARMMLIDLCRHFNVKVDFLTITNRLKDSVCGLTSVEINESGEEFITIKLNLRYVKTGSENEVLYTILHEIAHVKTLGHGHDYVWQLAFKDLLGYWAPVYKYHPEDLEVLDRC